MHEALKLLGELQEGDARWLLEAGRERKVDAETIVIAENAHPHDLFIILSGLVGVRVAVLGDSLLAHLGPGELLGEISFLESVPASATAVAIESTTLLAIPRKDLSRRLESDAAFAARFYKALALLGARRLRERVGTLARWRHPSSDPGEHAPGHPGEALTRAFGELKELLHQAGEEAKNPGSDPYPRLAPAARELFLSMLGPLDAEIGDEAPGPPDWRAAMGRRFQREFLPYLLLSRFGERSYTKPRGYAGDYVTIEWIYRNEPDGQGAVGKLIDAALMDSPPARAVRNRRGILAGVIRETLERKGGDPVHVASFACGPAEEVFDVLGELDDPSRLSTTLIDIDWEALGYVARRLEREARTKHVKLEHANLVYLATGRQTIDLHDLDLVYSIGLIDYFEDQFVVALLNYAHHVLAPGGKVVFGNFHPRNRGKAFMDHVVDWKMIHRTEEDMNRLFAASRFKAPCTRIQHEAERINMFAEGVKS